ncbi:MAG TPA: TraM recognition domain-containing protein [Puia sp.]|nr:TraM recognition domain-containing protein [Puia sp.]
MGGVRLSRVISRSLRGGAFRRHNEGFQQEEQLRKTDFSLHLRARYKWQGKWRDSYISFINSRRGILICGSPGSGKSWFLIEPMIGQLTEKGFALFVFDFKFPVLSQHVYDQFQRNRDKYPASTQFYCINFTDLSRSHRCNVIAPESMEYMADAIGASRTILLSMNKTWVNRQGDFFVESPVNFLAALIWFLRKYQGGIYCTLPHAIELAQVPYDKLFTLLNAEPEIQTLIGPFIEAYRNKTMEMLDSQLSSARIPLGRLASPDLYYVLTGNDGSLDINDPAAPKILCLGGDPPRQEALAPILSLYIDRLNKRINQQGKYKCALVCDEFATVRAYSMTTIIATGRSNNIVPIIAVQDLSQLRTQYSRDEADLFLNIAGNLVCGQVGGETARWVSERFPGVVRYNKTVSVNSSDTSVSRSEQTTSAVDVATIANLSSGEFVGIVADDPELEVEFKAFHARITKDAKSTDRKRSEEMPVVRQVDAAMIEANFQQVKREIEEMVTTETQRILGDPVLSKKMVKR